MIKVLKKNNQVVEWDFSKIVKASNKAAKRVTKQLTEEQKSELEVIIKNYTKGRDVISVAELHNIVETGLEKIASSCSKS